MQRSPITELEQLRIRFLAGTLSQGGAERQLFYILDTLKRGGANVGLLCLTRGEFWESRIQELGVAVQWVGSRGSRAARVASVLRAMRAENVEILQSQHFYTNLYAVAAARILGLAEFGAIRNDVTSEIEGSGRVLGWLSLRLPRVLVANSRRGIERAVSLGVPSNRLRFLPNVIDTDTFQPRSSAPSPQLRLLTVGRLVEQKRIDRFLHVLARLQETVVPPPTGVVLGDGPLRRELEQRAQSLGLLPHAVEFRGNVPDVTRAYAECDVVVLMSDWEGTPNVILEAMASGVPVVSTGVGDVPDLVTHEKTGFLIDPGDEPAAASFLAALASNPELRQTMGRLARTASETNRSVSLLPRLLLNLYGRTIN